MMPSGQKEFNTKALAAIGLLGLQYWIASGLALMNRMPVMMTSIKIEKQKPELGSDNLARSLG